MGSVGFNDTAKGRIGPQQMLLTEYAVEFDRSKLLGEGFVTKRC
jgi:hypothetical protein